MPLYPSQVVTASRAVVSDASGRPTAATTTATEIGYVNGVTSALQTQIDGKAISATPGSYTPAYVSGQGSGTLSSVSGTQFRIGHETVLYGTATCGVSGTGGSTVVFNLPQTANTTDMPGSLQVIGSGSLSNGSTFIVKLNTSTSCFFQFDATGVAAVGTDFPAGRVIYWRIQYMVSGW